MIPCNKTDKYLPQYLPHFYLASFDVLQDCTWIDEPRNLIITGGAGAGKTHIANALCITALHQLRSVKYIRANRLLQESEKVRTGGKAFDWPPTTCSS